MALKVYKFEQPRSTQTPKPVLLTAEEIDKPAKGVLSGFAIMIPFYLFVAAIVSFLKRF
jgi:hypothetical protein